MWTTRSNGHDARHAPGASASSEPSIHRAHERPTTGLSLGSRPSDAVALLTVYLVLLLAIPSNVRIAALGSLGRPSLLWGLFLFGLWCLWRLQAEKGDLLPVAQPVRVAYFALVVIALGSFTAAVFRGQPEDQVVPAATSLLRLLSWGGPLLVAMDGIRTTDALTTVARRIAVGGALLAALGLAQFVAGDSLLGWVASIPGLELHARDVIVRGGFARASGTSIHPLEHSTALSAAVPLALVMALQPGRAYGRAGSLIGWGMAVLIALGSVAAVSRSAVIGFAVAVIVFIPAVPARVRAILVAIGTGLTITGAVAFPGLFRTIVALFELGNDTSAESRTVAFSRIPEFASSSPLIGVGFGTFLPRYYILDNQWALILIELGVLGFVAFLGVFLAAMATSHKASTTTNDPRLRLLGRALGASVLTVAVLLAFFDGLAFPIAAGLTFLLCGLCSAVRAVDSRS